MNLLEVVNNVSAAAHNSKEQVAATGEPKDGCRCNNPYCRTEISSGVIVMRGGEHICTMYLEDTSIRHAFNFGARLYGADIIACCIDGKSMRDDRAVIAVTAINRAGDQLHRVEPYTLSPDGRKVYWQATEVPAQSPIVEWDRQLTRIMNMRPIGLPPFMNEITPGMTYEQRQAIMDIGITKQIAQNVNHHNVKAVLLAADAGTARERILHLSGIPEGTFE